MSVAPSPADFDLGTGGLVEWHPGELFPRVGFVVTNLSRPAERVVAFYNQRGTADQYIKEGKNAINWTRGFPAIYVWIDRMSLDSESRLIHDARYAPECHADREERHASAELREASCH